MLDEEVGLLVILVDFVGVLRRGAGERERERGGIERVPRGQFLLEVPATTLTHRVQQLGGQEHRSAMGRWSMNGQGVLHRNRRNQRIAGEREQPSASFCTVFLPKRLLHGGLPPPHVLT